MKSTKLFVIGLYVYLGICLSLIGVPMLLGWGNIEVDSDIMFVVIEMLLGVIVILGIWGWLLVIGAFQARKSGMESEIRRAWKWLKYATIPFYIVNFLYSVFAWGILVGASRGLAVLLVPIPVVVTCMIIVQSGCVGWFYIKYLKKDKGIHISFLHYLLQLISVLDVISTIIILRKEKKYEINNRQMMNAIDAADDN